MTAKARRGCSNAAPATSITAFAATFTGATTTVASAAAASHASVSLAQELSCACITRAHAFEQVISEEQPAVRTRRAIGRNCWLRRHRQPAVPAAHELPSGATLARLPCALVLHEPIAACTQVHARLAQVRIAPWPIPPPCNGSRCAGATSQRRNWHTADLAAAEPCIRVTLSWRKHKVCAAAAQIQYVENVGHRTRLRRGVCPTPAVRRPSWYSSWPEA